jgi:hypothetical protein
MHNSSTRPAASLTAANPNVPPVPARRRARRLTSPRCAPDRVPARGPQQWREFGPLEGRPLQEAPAQVRHPSGELFAHAPRAARTMRASVMESKGW